MQGVLKNFLDFWGCSYNFECFGDKFCTIYMFVRGGLLGKSFFEMSDKDFLWDLGEVSFLTRGCQNEV
jgi:hypothetical protein